MTSINNENDFQINMLEYKLKKIKKRKNKYKNNNNQKIKKLEILDNLPKNEIINLESIDSNKELIKDSILDTNEYNKNQNLLWYKKSQEGFQDKMPKFNDDNNWDGLDDYNSQNGDDIGYSNSIKIKDIINEIYINLITFNCFLALCITCTLTQKEPNVKISNLNWNYIHRIINIDTTSNSNDNPFTGGSENINKDIIKDSNAVYGYICLIEALISAFFFSFGWFYIMFYCYHSGKKNSTFFDYITVKNFEGSENIFIKLFFFVFQYSLVTLEVFRSVIEKKIPKYTKIFNKSLCYLFLFYIIYNINHKHISYFKNFLIQLINGEFFKNPLVGLLCFFIFGKYIQSTGLLKSLSKGAAAGAKGLASKAKSFASAHIKTEGTPAHSEGETHAPAHVEGETPAPAPTEGETHAPTEGETPAEGAAPPNLSDALSKFSDSVGPGSTFFGIMKTILNIVIEIIRIMIIYFIAIPIGILLCLLYFLWTSIITNIRIVFFSNSIFEIINFIKLDSNYRDNIKTNSCNTNKSIWQEIINIFTGIIDLILNSSLVIFNNLPFIIFVFYCSYVIGHSLHEIIDETTKQIIHIIHIIFCCIIILFLTNVVFKWYKKEKPGSSIISLLFDPPSNIQTDVFKFIFYITICIILFTIILFIILFVYHNLVNNPDGIVPIFTTIKTFFLDKYNKLNNEFNSEYNKINNEIKSSTN